MGYTIPGWLDEVLDFIGINFPNVDEDDYREMADAMRDFADKFEGHGADAHKAVSRILSSSQGWAVDAMNKHWNQVKAGHLEKMPELARLFADACDALADIIFWMKRKAETELTVMAGSVGLSIGLAWVTGGLSAVLGAAEITAMRQAVKRIIDEAADRIVDEVIAKVTEPVNAKLEAMVEDMVLDLTDDAFSMPPTAGSGAGHDAKGGHGGMQLASAGGAGGSSGDAGKTTKIDHVEFEDGAGKVSRHGGELHLAASAPLHRARGAFGRSKGRDPFTQIFDTVLHGALKGSEKALKKIATHITDTVPERVKATSRLHKGIDQDVRSRLDAIRLGNKDGGTGRDGMPGIPGQHRKPGDAYGKPSPLTGAKDDPRRHAIPLTNKTCENDPVDVATGEMTLPCTDLSLPGVLPLVLRRTHLSDYRYGQWFGHSWASTLDERLELDPLGQGAVWAREDGSLLVYPRLPAADDSAGVLPVEGPRLALRYDGHDNGTTTYCIADLAGGWTRSFTGSPYFASSAYWLTAIEDRNGNRIVFHRDGNGAPAAASHSGGYQVSFSVADDRIQKLALRTPEGPHAVLHYGYDPQGNLETVVNSSGSPLRYTYDDTRMTAWTDRNDSTFRYVYDDEGRVVRTVGPDGILSSTFTYTRHPDTGDRITQYTNSTGATSTYYLNSALQVVAKTDPLGHTTHILYDDHDRVLAHTDPLGATTHYERDLRGNLTGLRAADGTVTHAVYNEWDLPVTVTERGGATSRFEYDARGNRTAAVTSDGARTEYTYNDRGHAIAIRNAVGDVTRITTDAAGLPIGITAPSGATTTLIRDPFGRVIEATDPLGNTLSQGWTTEGRPAWRQLPDGSREEWTWDGEGNLTSHTDRMGRTTRHRVTHFDKPTATSTADGADYRFTHDTELRLTAVTNAAGLQWTYTYDTAGRLTSETDFDGRTITYEHDALGRLTRRTNAAGQSLTFERDILGRVTYLRHDDGSTSTFTRDDSGHVTRITNPYAIIDLTRDTAGRIITETVNGATTLYAYDPLGRRTHRQTPSGATSTLTYDTGGLASYTSGEHTFAFERDALGREITRILDGTPTLHHTWDSVGRILAQTLITSQDGPIERSFTYQPDGTLTRVQDSLTGERTYTLDTASRITAVHARGWSETYAYNTAGDLTHSSLPERAPGQDHAGPVHYTGSRLTRAGRIHDHYDAQGRVIRRETITLSGKTLTWHFTWNAEDRLTHVTTPHHGRWHYLYDALGRRIAKCRLDENDHVLEHITYTWDGAQLAEQHTDGISLTWDYLGQHPLAQRESKTADQREAIDRRFFAIVTDLSGAPSELITPDGTLAWRARSTAWGATQWNRDCTAYTPLRYPGQHFDPETGLHYNVNRYYDPRLGRYLTPDPLGLAPAANHYAYVPNPFILTDPLGLAGCTADPTWGGKVVWVRDEHGRPYEMHATITRDMLGEGTDANPSIRPPGFVDGRIHNQARGHMLAKVLGGSGDHPDNLFTITQRPTNSPEMRDLELQIRDAVRGSSDRPGEIVQYSVYLEYADNEATSVPSHVYMEADGSRGFRLDRNFPNPDQAAQLIRRRDGIE
ncbi:RHS repeat-associated core domain-containing protein [Streptomyces sp. NPDC017405]|uniref:RHS repeat-associated core domain-containing protein n=1 Tax=unclassified Streptomyces TaxID=2593676 RepID=UPI0037A1E24F